MPPETTESVEEVGLEHSESSDSSQTNADPLNQGQSDTVEFPEESESSIPEKFVGKSAAEIIASYQELERHASRLGGEKSAAEKRSEEIAQKAAQYEQYIAQISQHGGSSPQTQQNTDPISSFNEAWETQGPKAAIEMLVAQNVRQQQVVQEQRALEDTKSYVERLKSENPEFVELMPEMQALATQYELYLAPSVRMSKQAVDIMFNLAKAKNISKLAAREATNLSAKTELAKTKKRMSGSESSSTSKGDSTVSFAELSTVEMEKLLGVVDK